MRYLSLFLVLCLLVGCKERIPFQGSSEFDSEVQGVEISLDDARGILDEYLLERGESYNAFPEDVIMVYRTGFLFVQGDFKLRVMLEGYYVDGDGNVGYVDLGRSVSTRDYLDRVGKDGWDMSAR